MSKVGLCACVCLLFWAAEPAAAAPIDVPAQINALLGTKPTFTVMEHRTRPVTHTVCRFNIHIPDTGEVCYDVTENEDYLVPVQHVLSAASLSIVGKGPVVYGNAIFGEIPDQVFSKATEITNCETVAAGTPLPVSHPTLKLSLSTKKTVDLTTALANIRSENIDINVNQPTFGNIEEGLVFSRSFPTDMNTGYTEDSVVERSDKADVPMPGLTTQIVQIVVVRIHGRMPFTSSMVVDGSTNDGKKVSDYLDVASRTFTVTGDLIVDGGTDSKIRVSKTDFDTAWCTPAQGLVVKQDISLQGKKLTEKP